MKTYKAFIEIPKDDDRRRHKKYDSDELIDLGPIKDLIPVNDGKMPVSYGFIVGTKNLDEERPEELDVLVFSNKTLEIAETLDIIPIGLITREDGDHKIIAISTDLNIEWKDVDEKEKNLIIEYFGYKSKIKSIETGQKAIELIDRFS
jgi:inorganic pyrophosphatase